MTTEQKTPPRQEPLCLEVEEVAQTLRLSKAMIYKMIECKEIPSVRFGEAVRVPYQPFLAWFQEKIGQAHHE